MTLSTRSPRAKQRWELLFVLVTAFTLLAGGVAIATHYEASLEGSNFEIDNDANLVRNVNGMDDWATLAHALASDPEKRATDKPTGQTDDSYAGGVKEDTPCPGETTGSIPNNKSDLKTFSVYQEAGTGSHPGFIHLAWSRVSEPSGTTLMDFEFNQSSTACSSGPNKVRTAGDLLIEYSIVQGGARAELTKRTWTGSAWGDAVVMSAANPLCGGASCATGTINATAITQANADGLGATSARTFGEASIDLRSIFQAGKCSSFGSAMLKSRSSDSFTSQLKDFIRPVGIELTNCGKVIIRKVTNPAGSTTSFGYTKAFSTDPATTPADTFSLTGVTTNSANVKEFSNVLFGTGLTVTENTPLPTGWQFASLDCSASTGIPAAERVVTDRTVTFTIDDEQDVLDCTYTNQALGAIKVVKNTTPSSSTTFDFTPTNFNSGTNFTLAGNGGNQTFTNVAAGSSYAVQELAKTGWDLSTAQCKLNNGAGAATGSLTGRTISSIEVVAGQTTLCTFTNTQQGTIIVKKVTDPVTNPTTGPQFTYTGDVAGTIRHSGTISVSNLSAGTYTSVEASPGPAYDLTSITCDDSSSTTASSGSVATRTATFKLDPGETVTCTFTNTKRAQLDITKVDDANSDPQLSNRLNGATFTLYTDVNNAKGVPVGTTVANPNSCTTAGTGTDAGKCSIANILPGTYWVVETTTPTGYAPAADEKITLTAGQTLSRTYVDPRLHKVIVIVCHEGTNDLAPSSVQLGTTTKTSLSGVGLTAQQQADICTLGGATFGGLSHGNQSVTVNVGSGPH